MAETLEDLLERVHKDLEAGIKIVQAYADPFDIAEDPEDYYGTDDGTETLAMAYENLQSEAVGQLRKAAEAIRNALEGGG